MLEFQILRVHHVPYSRILNTMLCFFRFPLKHLQGSYYAYQEPVSGNHDSIMSNQLSGYWFLHVGGAPENAVSEVNTTHLSRSRIIIYDHSFPHP